MSTTAQLAAAGPRDGDNGALWSMLRRVTGPGPLLVAAAALPLAFDPASGFVNDCILALAYAVMALGLNIIVGFAGLLDLGYVAFFAIGAYTIGWLGSTFFAGVGGGHGWHVLAAGFAEQLPGIHLNFVLVLLAAVALTTVAGVAIGVPTLRLRGDYIAIVTLAFGEIIGRVAHNGDEIRLAGVPLVGGALHHELGPRQALTAGPKGITPIDKVDLPFLHPFTALNLRPWYWLALALVAGVLAVNARLRDSRIGRAWVAVREDEQVAASLGIALVRTKLLAYGTGAAFGGIAGAFLGSFNNTVNSAEFEFPFSILILGMVIVGGLGSIPGVVAGAIALTFANYWLLPDVVDRLPLGADMSQFSYGIYGFLLVAMMLLRPRGLWPTAGSPRWARGTGRAAPPPAADRY